MLYAIGDIQGCCDEFELLLERIQFDPARDRLWLTGDLVNRGPRSLAALRLVKSLGDAVITVLGNHDLHLLAISAHQDKRKSQDTLDDILNAPDRDELLHWLRHRPLLHHDPALRLTLIHAGLPPQWDLELAQSCAREVETALRDEDRYAALFAHMYGNEPEVWSDELRDWERLRFITNCFTRLRICNAQGKLKLKFKGSAAEIDSGWYPWFGVPGRRTGNDRIVFGHWSALGFYCGDNALGLDTGCVWGGELCAVQLHEFARGATPALVCAASLDGGLPLEE